MKYLVFNTKQEALDAELPISISLGFPKDSTAVTKRWAIPQQIQDGRWVFVSPDDEGVEAGADWWPQEELI